MREPSLSLRSGMVYLVVAIAAATAGFALYHMWPLKTEPDLPSQRATHLVATELVGQRRPAFTLPDLNGESVPISRWDGNVVLLNFWATWCPPCRKEIPAFMETLDRYAHRGFQIIGVAIDDRDAVAEFVASLNADYPQLIGEESGIELVKRYGNHYGALPYSVLIDRTGLIRFIKPGELKREELETQLEKLL